MNTELLEKVKAHILEEPNRLRMNDWVRTDLDHLGVPLDERPACGTIACIAGWTLLLSGVDPRGPGAYSTRADKLLGLSEEQGSLLYFTASWPEQFENAYMSAKTRQERAEIAARRIDHFIATNGAD